MEYQIINEPKPAGRHQIWPVLLRDGLQVRQLQVTIGLEDDPAQIVAPQIETLWESAEVVPDGVQSWFAFLQRQSNDLLNATIFAVFATMQAGGDMGDMLQAGKAVLLAHPLQAALFGMLHQALANATPEERLEFTAMAFTVAYGKLGQR